jgi:alanyl-tRNA synthetase
MANMIQSQALYYEDPFLTRFTATITDVIPYPTGGYGLVLDQTYFYPTGGGQDHDIGTIDGNPVLDVQRDDETGLVRHIVEASNLNGVVSCEIDWQHRLRNMQHHSAQHLLTQCVLRLFDFPTVSANINGYSPSTLDVVAERLLTAGELEQAEELANQMIYENRSIRTYFVEPEDLEKIPLRRPPKVSENIRIVEIENYDYSACGGTHCSQTGMIGVLKVLKNERINNKTRLHFVAGHQALELFRTYHNSITNLAASLSANAQEIEAAVLRVNDALKQSQKEVQSLKREHLAYEAHAIIARSTAVADKKFAYSAFENRSAGELRILADTLKLQEKLIAVLTSYDGSRLSIVVTCGRETSSNAAQLLRQLLIQFDGKGGGDSQVAQGGGAVANADLDRLLNAGLQVVKDTL